VSRFSRFLCAFVSLRLCVKSLAFSLCAFAPSRLREASPPGDCVKSLFFFVSSCPCVFVLRFFAFIFVFSVSRWFIICIFGGCLPHTRRANVEIGRRRFAPCSRRNGQFQRQSPAFPPSKSRPSAPASRIPAVHSGGNFAILAFSLFAS
jgi:hypothetical protein